MELWCRGLTCLPVTQEIAGSNPVSSAIFTSFRDENPYWVRRSIVFVRIDFAVSNEERVSREFYYSYYLVRAISSVGRAPDF